MSLDRVIQAVLPDASPEVCHFILWGRTPFPFVPVSARMLYKAASGYHRASARGALLCDHCPRIADHNEWVCKACAAALRKQDEGAA